jgi:hypothetical protein
MDVKKNCQYCNKLIKETYLLKHQKTAKFCIAMQNELKDKEIEKLTIEKQNIEDQIKLLSTLKESHTDFNDDTLLNIQQTKTSKLHEAYLEYEKQKLQIEEESKQSVDNYVNKENIDNIDDFYNIDKIKFDKLQSIYSDFEQKKTEINEYYDKLIVEQKQYDEEIKKTDEEDNKKYLRLKKLEELQKEYEQRKIEIELEYKLSEEENHTHEKTLSQNSDISTDKNVVYQNNEILNINQEFKQIHKNTKKFRIKRTYEDTENKLYQHLILLLSEKRITSENIMYIVIDSFKFIDNYANLDELSKKDILSFVLSKYIDNNDYDDDDENIKNKNFAELYMVSFIDIIISIAEKKFRLKKKKNNCFFPFCS